MNFVIMAGGSGTRLWPMSRTKQPKQLAQLVTESTMLEDTITRLGDLVTNDNLYISTNATFAPMIQQILPNLSKDHYIVEPSKRDSGPAMAFVAAWMMRVAPDEPMALIAADHYVRGLKTFRAIWRVAEQLIKDEGHMVNIGIHPTDPNTNLGYLKVGEKLAETNGIHIFAFEAQREKPDMKTATQFLQDGGYFWNAGYFAWTPRKFVGAYQKFAPSIGNHIPALTAALEANDAAALKVAYEQMEPESIDYAVIEKMDATDVRTLRGDFDWADLGSWDMIYDELAGDHDSRGNLIKAEWQGLDTTNSLVYGQKGKIVATLGVDSLVVVDTPDALLVTTMGRARDLKKLVEQLKTEGLDNVL